MRCSLILILRLQEMDKAEHKLQTTPHQPYSETRGNAEAGLMGVMSFGKYPCSFIHVYAATDVGAYGGLCVLFWKS